jgi:PmbA protein
MLDKAIRYLDSKADGWEIFSARGNSRSAIIEKGKIKNISEVIEEGYSVRVIVRGKVGFATSNSPEKIIEICERALKLTRISEEKLEELPFGKASKVEGIYDKKVKEVDSAWIKNAIDRMIDGCDERVNPAHGTVEVVERYTRIINSTGADLESKATACSAYLEAVAKESSGFEMLQSRMLNLDFEFVATQASKLAIEGLNAEKIDKIRCDAVLSPIAVNQLLFFTLYPAFSAENIAKGRSMLAGKIGEDFGEFSIIDDGRLAYGLMSSPFDDEGVETKQTLIFDEGIFNSFISDFRYSRLLQVEPTGNGFRDEITSYPLTTPSNVILGFKNKSNSIEDDALVVHSFKGAHTSNPISGDFSLECQNSFLKEKPVKSAMLYGNVYELLRRIEVFGRDVRQIDNTVTPSIRFSELNVSG